VRFVRRQSGEAGAEANFSNFQIFLASMVSS
jgi:hypothetical protein